MKTMKRQRGLTALEMLFSVSIFGLVIAGALFSLIGTLSSWDRGQTRIQAELDCQKALRRITSTLQEAMYASVDADGMGITFHLPQKDSSGNIVYPISWDGITRRIELDGSTLRICNGAACKPLLENVTTQDPNDPSNGNYMIFVPGAGATTRQVTVQIAVSRTVRNNEQITARVREVVRLRNVPSLN